MSVEDILYRYEVADIFHCLAKYGMRCNEREKREWDRNKN